MFETLPPADGQLRAAARRRLEKRAGAWRFLLLWLVLTALFVTLWLVTSAGSYFWPVWPMIGIGIGVAFSFLDAYDLFGAVTERRVDDEVARMRG